MQDYDYNLPADRIAPLPLPQRDHSKLLVYKSGNIKDDTFYHLPQHLPPNTTLVLNNTSVIEARIYFQKPTGGAIEIFCLEPYSLPVSEALQQTKAVQWRCLIGGASKWKPGQVLHKKVMVEEKEIEITARYEQKEEDSFVILFEWEEGSPFAAILAAIGAIPLPPYIKRKAEAADADRYQTVFAAHKGSVAAPTAALHFSKDVFTNLAEKGITPQYVTLHVGAGTFKPVKTESIAQHTMHAENFSVGMGFLKSLQQAQNIVAVGTTSLRTLESLHWLGAKYLVHGHLKNVSVGQWEAYELAVHNYTYKETIAALVQYLQQSGSQQLWCRTALLMVPGYPFQSAIGLVTNFHQPRSTLLLLIAAFIGEDWKKIYEHALNNNYRFLSYGDSSLLWREQNS